MGEGRKDGREGLGPEKGGDGAGANAGREKARQGQLGLKQSIHGEGLFPMLWLNAGFT